MMNFLFVSLFSIFFGFTSPASPATPRIETDPVAMISDTDTSVAVVAENFILDDKGDLLVEKNLLAPLFKFKKIDKDAFSRCVSGYYPVIKSIPKIGNDYFQGIIQFNVGCEEGKTIAEFRINQQETLVEVLDSKTQKYISAEEWLKAYQGEIN